MPPPKGSRGGRAAAAGALSGHPERGRPEGRAGLAAGRGRGVVAEDTRVPAGPGRPRGPRQHQSPGTSSSDYTGNLNGARETVIGGV